MRSTPDAAVDQWFAAAEEELATTTVTVMEIEFGIARLRPGRRRTDLAIRLAALLSAMKPLPLDVAAARRGATFRAQREAQGRPSSLADMMIAGIVAAHGASLATRNISDFEGLGLTLVAP